MKYPSVAGIAEVLVVFGAINWGLVGLANINLLNMLVGSAPQLEQLFLVLIGLSGLYWLWSEVAGGSMIGGSKKKK